MSKTDILDRIDQCLRILKNASDAPLSDEERATIRKIALAYLYEVLAIGENGSS